jgi:hypothetical protein
MPNWQTTAKTIYCDAVDDEVTVMVYKDLSSHCTGCKKYTRPNQITAGLVKEKQRRLKRIIQCEGEDCRRVTGYKQSLLAEENQKPA